MVQVDVFTDRALTGNALAVFLDGRGLSTEQMQALARETNLSETTFILPGDPAAEKTRGVRVRIFTVQEELPFAGHPTLGTAFVLRGQAGALAGASEIRLDLNVGTVPVRFTQEPTQPAFGEMTQKNPEFGAIHDVEAVARFTGLSAADFDDSAPIQTVSTGVPFAIAALRSLKTLRPHDFLQRRRSGHRLRRRVLRRLDDHARRCGQRRAGVNRARSRSAPSQQNFCSRHEDG